MRIVLRIGGSVIASPIDSDLIAKYADVLGKLKAGGHDVAVVVGGGALAREFIHIAKSLGLDEEAQDEIAISVSRIFAQLFSEKIGKDACETIPMTIKDALRHLNKGKVVVMGGLKPGMTTDAVAALIAERSKADLLVKGTDQDGVYDKDPKKHPDAVKFDRLSIDDLSSFFSEKKHKAGIHQIIDPEAVKILSRYKVKTVVVDGFNPENVLMAVEGKPVGTLIA